jgi:riboflavin synthase
MFTGIIEEIGTVVAVDGQGDSARLSVACQTVLADAQVGDSISVNGACLTVTAVAPSAFTADLMGETLDRTALGVLRPGSSVNLERAVRVDGRLGGHLVQGHIDGVAEVVRVEPQEHWTVMTFTLPPHVAPYLVEKGSITIDGTSLTVMALGGGLQPTFSVGLIPHTLAVTVLGRREVGDRVNLEVDVVAKYVERMLAGRVSTPYIPGGGASAAVR